MENNFSMFIPFDILEKGKDKDGKEVMVIGGVVSDETTGADLDGDIIEIEGMDLSKFMKSGFVNFNHLAGKDPSMIIGEPISYEKKNGKLIVKSKLYSDSEMAKKVYELANTLNKNSSTRKLGYSIEGQVVSRDDKDSRRIKKSAMSGLAVAPHPKCHGTGVVISKGVVEYEPLDNSELLIDIINENGERITVNKNLEIQKAIVAGDSTGRDTTNQVSNGDTLKKEDIDGAKKKRTKKFKEEIAKKDFFSKSDLALLNFSMFNNIDVESVKNICDLTERIQRQLTPNMEVTKISKEAIQKALVTLNLVEATPEVDKAKEEAEKKAAEELKKAEEAKALLKSEYEEIIKKAEELKNKIEGKVTPVVAAATQTTTIAKVEEPKKDETLEKAIAQVGALGTLVQATLQENEELKKGNEELIKSIGEIKQFTTSLAEKLGMIEKQPLDRKSITTQSYIEKGGEAAVNGMKDVKTLSISNAKHREEVANTLFKAAVASGVNESGTSYKDQELVKATSYVELGSFPPQDAARIQTRLLKEFKINLVK